MSGVILLLLVFDLNLHTLLYKFWLQIYDFEVENVWSSVHILNQQGLWRNVDCYRKLFWFVTQHFATNSVDEDKLEPGAFLNKNCLKSDIVFPDMNCCSLTVNILISVFSRSKLVSWASFTTSFPLGKTVTKAYEKKCSSNVYT